MQGVNLGEAWVRRGYVNMCKHNHHQNGCWGRLFTVGCNWQVFRAGKNIFRVWYNNKNISHPFPCHWGVGRDGLQRGTLDDVF